MLSVKAMRILKVLLLSEGKPVTVKGISSFLEMSERSINTYLKEVKAFCESNNISYISKRGTGISIELDKKSKRYIESLSDNDSQYYDSYYRLRYVLGILLNGWQNYTIGLFADELYMSKATINKDLLAVESWLELMDLKLVRKSKKGLYIEGSEKKKREALYKVWHMDNGFDIKKNAKRYDFRLGKMDSMRLEKYVGRECLSKICESLQKFEREEHKHFMDYSFAMMAEYLSIQLKRIQRGNILEEGEVPKYIEGSERDDFADKLEKDLRIDMPRTEKDYVRLLMMGAEMQENSIGEGSYISEVSQSDVVKISGDMTEYMSQVFGISLNSDAALNRVLTIFMYHSLVRTKYHFMITNPFLDDIKRNYPNIFIVCFSLSSMYKKAVGTEPSEQEIGYLTLLVGSSALDMQNEINVLLIGNGNPFITKMAARKIKQNIDNLQIDCAFSCRQMECMAKNGYDITISMVPDFEGIGDTVYITPIVTEEEVEKIKRRCSEFFAKKAAKKYFHLDAYVSPEFIMLDVPPMPKDKLLEMACRKFEDEGYVNGNFYKEVMRREEISTTEINDGIAIPHGVANTIIKPAVFLMRLKQPMKWGNEMVDLIFLLALNFNDISTIRQFFKMFYSMVGNKDKIDAIRKSSDVDGVIRIFAE